MDYVQMTLDDWMNMKESLKKDLIGVQESFVRIGYKLRKIADEKLYEKDGYKSIADFAKAEYGLTASTVSRFIKINERYSVEGYSDRLRPEFANFGSSKLSEMLTLPDNDIELITQNTTRETIRELKQFEHQKPEDVSTEPDEPESKYHSLIEKFWKQNKETLNELYTSDEKKEGYLEGMAEIVNPSGNRSFRDGFFFVMFYEDNLKIKKFGAPAPEKMSWEEFFSITEEIFADAGNRTWEEHFGEPEKTLGFEQTERVNDTQKNIEKQHEPVNESPKNVVETAENVNESPENVVKTVENVPETEKNVPETLENETDQKEQEEKEEQEEPKPEEPEICAGAKTQEDARVEEESSNENLPGQMDIEKDFPEYCPDPAEEKEEQEEIKTYYGSRKQYLDSLNTIKAALYIAASLSEMRSATYSTLVSPRHWEQWLMAEVDENGEEIQVVEG